MPTKPCPVDRGKLLIGLEHCRTGADGTCKSCPYENDECTCFDMLSSDSLEYIYYLEE